SGWANYSNASGRVIVGTGGGYSLGATGGSAQVTLTVNQMPIHKHLMSHSAQSGGVYGKSSTEYDTYFQHHRKNNLDRKEGKRFYQHYSEPVGGGQPFDNRQPYLALNYCYKL